MQAALDAKVLRQVALEIRDIKLEYRGVASEESIELIADQSLQSFAGSRVPQFIALFVGRLTRERLQKLTGFRPRVGFTQPMASQAVRHNARISD